MTFEFKVVGENVGNDGSHIVLCSFRSFDPKSPKPCGRSYAIRCLGICVGVRIACYQSGSPWVSLGRHLLGLRVEGSGFRAVMKKKYLP